MSVIVGKQESIYIGFQAEIVQDDVELAWAEKFHTHNPAYAWILGKFVGADEANANRHVFPLAELEAYSDTIQHGPLNINHSTRRVVGTFVASQMLYPEKPQGEGSGAHMEALSAFWKFVFPDDYREVQKANAEGSLWYSMECLPEKLTCAGALGCGETFPYKGPQSPTYCAHLNKFSLKQITHPHFTGGALVVPPETPAWKKADAGELARWIEEHSEDAHAIYEAVRRETPHLDVDAWEALMGEVVQMGRS